ncbi:MAG TPA: ParB/RepB/Spo0J family partition protein [Thermoanaerobaculia bacterium]|nr:ParB/RepB/Spo0J family partition protein [Thermoanaerobaculia bacterium]
MTADRRKTLGRGLSALLPGKEGESRPGAREAELAALHPNPLQPRTDFDARGIAELAESIRANGIVQPIVVSPRSAGGYTILAGERRFRAAKEAGLTRVPIVVRDAPSDRERLELALVENLQREDLNPMESAAAYGRLREEFKLTQEQISERVGKERSTIANSLRLLKLPAQIRDMIRGGALTAGHAKALIALPSADDQVRLAEEIVRRDLSVRQAEKRAAAMAGAGPRVKREKPRDPFTKDAEEKLSRRLRARVRLERRKRGGRIEIDLGSVEDGIRLYVLLMGKG